MVTEKHLAKAAKSAVKETTRKPRSKAANARIMAKWEAATPIEFVGDENPHPKGSFAFKLREAVKKCSTVGAFITVSEPINVGGSSALSFLKEWNRRGLVTIGARRRRSKS